MTYRHKKYSVMRIEEINDHSVIEDLIRDINVPVEVLLKLWLNSPFIDAKYMGTITLIRHEQSNHDSEQWNRKIEG